MKIESLESRIVFAQGSVALGSVIEFEVDTSVEITPAQQEPVTIPADVQFRSTADDFRYESATLDPNVLNELVAATEEWKDDPIPWRTFKMTDSEAWRKSIKHNPVTIHEDGYVIADRIDSDLDAHTLLTIQKLNSECYMHGGLYSRPDYHYRFSFDVRLPESERSWLERADGNWAVVTQMWGPREDGEEFLPPPVSVYTQVREGTPYWVVRNIGDSNRITRPNQPEFYDTVRIPMTDIGEWHNFDIEYVPNWDGQGMMRAWLDGELVAEWVDVKSAYKAQSDGEWTGPLNPAFGLYSYNNADGQTAHFDNMQLQCGGAFESSIAGRISGSESNSGVAVYATNIETGEKIGTRTEKSGVYVLNVPKGEYTITAVEEATNRTATSDTVSTLDATARIADLTIQDSVPAPVSVDETMMLTGDFNGDGATDLVNLLADGSWQVTLMNGPVEEAVESLASRDRRTGVSEPTDTAEEEPTAPVNEPTDTTEEEPTAPVDEPTETTEEEPTAPVDEPTDTTEEEPTAPVNEPTDTTEEEPTAPVDEPTDTTEEEPTAPVDEPEPPTLVNPNPGPADTAVWTTWGTDVEWLDIQVADFNGDGLDDIAGRSSTNGAWWVAESTGTGFVNRQWGSWTNGIEWLDVLVGDFNGDGRSDIAGRAGTNGAWWVSTSTGDKFQNTEWGRWTVKIDWEMVVGDFNGDGMDDVAGRAATDGTWWIGVSNGTRFQNSYWGRFTTKVAWNEFVVGDFNGDGLDDILGRAKSDGTMWIAQSHGDRFLNSYWGRWNNNVEWFDVSVADVNGDGATDFVGRASSDGTWWAATSDGEKFVNQYWGALWRQDVDWLNAVVEDFDGDGTADLFGVSNDNWWLSV